MSLGVAFHELQLIRIERHLSTAAASSSAVASGAPMPSPKRGRPGTANATTPFDDRRLFLGDVHTDPEQRVVYRPMGFQQPVVPHQVSLFFRLLTMLTEPIKQTNYYYHHHYYYYYTTTDTTTNVADNLYFKGII